MEINPITAGITAFVTGTVSGFVARIYSTNDVKQENSKLSDRNKVLESDLSSNKKEIGKKDREIKELLEYKTKYDILRKNIKSSPAVSESYYLPVFITGPRSVGKSSLVEQWNAPWNHSEIPATVDQRTAIVPISYFHSNNLKPHFLDPSIDAKIKMHLILKVHDFPGELSIQERIIDQAKKDTLKLQETTGKNLGIVLVCMLDSLEVKMGLQRDTESYFNGKFFQQLNVMQRTSTINVDRLILVFNKYDLLKEQYPNKGYEELMTDCMRTFEPAIKGFRDICDSKNVYPVFTILSRENMLNNNQGALIVKGAASQRFVEVMAGQEAAQTIVAPHTTAEHFWD
jgi:GTPase SAR1 family protein